MMIVKLYCAPDQKALDKQRLGGDSSPGNVCTGKAKQVLSLLPFFLYILLKTVDPCTSFFIQQQWS